MVDIESKYLIISSISSPNQVYHWLLSYGDKSLLKKYSRNYDKEGFFILLLIKNNSLSGYVYGLFDKSTKSGEIIFIEIFTSERGQGLCKNLFSQAFKVMKDEDIQTVEVLNVSGEKSYKCYLKAAELVGYNFECGDKDRNDYCISMIFTLSD